MFSRVWQLCCLPIARVRHWASTVFQWIRKWSLACRPSQNGSRSTSLTRSVSSEDDIRRPLLEGETTELSVHQCNFFELLVFGSVTDGASLDFFIYQPSTLLTSPVFAFTAPITSFQVLEKCFQLVTGVNTELVRCHMGPNPLQFQMMRVSGWNRSSSNCSTFIASAGWPDLTGGSALSAPCLTDIDKLNAVQTSLISQLADCTVIVVERLTRLDVLFLTKFMRRQKWVIIWHNLESTEEFKEASECSFQYQSSHNGSTGTGSSNIFHCSSDNDTTHSLENISQMLSLTHGQDYKLNCKQLLYNCVQKAVQESHISDAYNVVPNNKTGAHIQVIRKQTSM